MDERDETTARRGLVTGATGYVGALVVESLLERGWDVRVLVRDRARLTASWAEQVEVVEGDAQDGADLERALRDVDTAWFLIHAMGEGGDFARQEQEMARGFGQAARRCGVSRIVYLGGLHPEGELSEHLASRVRVGEILMTSGVPTAAIQAGVVLGDGSASFEMLAALSERLPAAGGPAWLRNRIQPIDARDVVHYLVAAADLAPEHNRTFDVGGPDQLSYAEMMQRYARVMGMGPRPVATAPVVTPRLASYWIGLVTPVDHQLAAPLVASMLHDTVVKERDLDALVDPPPGGLTGFDDAVRAAASQRDVWRFAKALGATGVAVAATAMAGAVATRPGSVWYRTRRKPSWQPPGWVFGPVWSALYADIAVVSALHLTDALEDGDQPRARRFAAGLAGNLALNATWSAVFFRQRDLRLATVVAAVLAASSTDLVRQVGARRERAVALAPYAAWTLFATALTKDLHRRNPHD